MNKNNITIKNINIKDVNIIINGLEKIEELLDRIIKIQNRENVDSYLNEMQKR